MRCLFFFLFVLTFSAKAQEEGSVTKNIQTDFGAYGDGLHNDHEAFKDASTFFNERKGNGTLIIPAGTYIVGRQLDYGSLIPIAYRPFADEAITCPYFKLGIPVLFISGCKNFTVESEGKAVIRFANDMLLGGFQGDGAAIPLKDKQGKAIVGQQNSIATIGDGIYIENSKNIKISGIELDGNAPEQRIGGNVSVDGWQWGQSGIVMVDVTNCTLENVKVHHFVVDGLQIRNATASVMEKITSQHIELLNSSFDNNGRQGFSWTGGAGLNAVNCSFSHTGRAYNHYMKAILSTSPGAGVDIEPESDPNVNIYRMIKDATFRNCTFVDNRGVGMVADIYNEHEYRIAQDISFYDCTFWGTTFWSVWVSQPGFTFNNCKIYGSAVHSFDGNKPGKETKFMSCFFEDKLYTDEKGKRIPPYGSYLVEIADGRRTTFDDCIFTSHKKYYHYLASSDPKSAQGKFIVHNCRFLNASGTDKPKNSIADGVSFTGNNQYIDLPSK